MSGDTANPRVWVDATVSVGPVGTTAPTDIATPLNAAFDDIGLLSEDGMTESQDQEVTKHYAWGGILVRTTRSKHNRQIKVTALEDNALVFGLVNPGSTVATATGITTRTVHVPGPNKKAWVIETVDGDFTRRRCIPTGEVIEVGEIKSSDSEMSMVELTIDIYPDSDGVLYLDVTDDPQAEE